MNEIYQSGLSGDRVMELLRRQFVVPTLSSAPTTNTLRWVDDMGYTNTFRVGELCRVAIDNGYTFYILKDLKDGVATWELMGSSGGEGDADLTPVYNLIKTKLDNSYFRRIFSPLDANGNEIAPNDVNTPISSIRVNYGLWSESFLSAKGRNSEGTSSGGGASALYQLNDVLADGTQVSGAQNGAVFVYDGKLGKWKGIAQSEIVPNLTGYAKESWVLQQGFLTGITSAMVTGALGYTPYDSAEFTKANIKSTLGISDWALASSKPSYTTKEVAEDTNLYFTDARAVAALKSITDGLQSDIDTKLDASVFYELFEKVTLEGGVTAIRAKYGLFTDYFLSAKGANSSGGSSSGGGLITSLYRYVDLGKTFSDTNNDTFNAYTINKINADLGSRISVLEGKATNVSFTQSLTSGTQIGSISIDGVAKNIYAPTIPTKLSQFTDDVVSGKYLPLSGGEVGSLLISSASNTPLMVKTTTAYAWSGICFLNNNGVSVGNIGVDNNRPIFVPKELNDMMYILHSGNYTDYTYSKSTIDTKLGGYLPLSGGTIAGDLQIDKGTDVYTSLRIGKNGVGREIVIHNTGGLGGLTTRSAVLSLYNNGTMISGIGLLESEPIYVKADSSIQFLIHSGNIGSQSVASADKLTTARSLWGQSFDGTGDINGGIIAKSIIPTTSWVSDTAQLRANATDTNYYVGVAATNNGYAVIQGGNAGVGAIPLLLNPNGGNLLIGTTTDSGYKLDVNGVIHSNTGIFSDGYVSAKGQNTSSDMRLKNVLNDVVLNVSDIANAPSIRFAWKNGGGIDVGSSAQYWQRVLPDAVKERDELEMQYGNIALLSTIAIAKRVETHEERIETHEERIARLEKENKELRNEINCLRYGA